METAALLCIMAETPQIEADLQRQLRSAVVAKRENSGAGFFTHIRITDGTPINGAQTILGFETYARVNGFQYEVGFVLFLVDGKLSMLECYTFGNDSTAELNPFDIDFEMVRRSVYRSN